MSYEEKFVKGVICTPGAKGELRLESETKEIAFPIMLPVKVLVVDSQDKDSIRVKVMEPHGKLIRFQADDVEVENVDEAWWDKEWERHSNPESHRWDTIKIITKYGDQVYVDWECGPFPIAENKEFFKKVFASCRLYNHNDDPGFKNALIDLTLLMFGEDSDPTEVTQDQVDHTVYTIYQLLTCQKFTKSGIDWSNINEEDYLNSLESLKEEDV